MISQERERESLPSLTESFLLLYLRRVCVESEPLWALLPKSAEGLVMGCGRGSVSQVG